MIENMLTALIAFSAVLYLAEPLFKSDAAASDTDGTSGIKTPGSSDDFDPTVAILDEIADLDLERAAGKIADANYDTVRGRLVAEAASALKQQKEIHPDHAETQADSTAPSIQNSGRPACPSCGTIYELTDRFCAACGAKVGTANDAGKKETT